MGWEESTYAGVQVMCLFMGDESDRRQKARANIRGVTAQKKAEKNKDQKYQPNIFMRCHKEPAFCQANRWPPALMCDGGGSKSKFRARQY